MECGTGPDCVCEPAFVDDDEPQDLGDPDGGHRQIVALETYADLGHRPAGKPGEYRSPDQSNRHRQAKAPEMLGRGRGCQDRRGIGPNTVETGDTGVEEAAHAPLYIQGKAQDCVDTAQDQKTDRIEKETGEFHQSNLPLKRPWGRKMSRPIIRTKATAVL